MHEFISLNLLTLPPGHFPGLLLRFDFLLFLGAIGWFLCGFLAFELRHRSKRLAGAFPAWGEFAFFSWVLCFRSIILLFDADVTAQNWLDWLSTAAVVIAAFAAVPLLVRLFQTPAYRTAATALLLVILLCLGVELPLRVLSVAGWLQAQPVSLPLPLFLSLQTIPAWVCLAYLAFCDYKSRPETSSQRLLSQPGTELFILAVLLSAGYLLLETTRTETENAMRAQILGKARVALVPLVWSNLPGDQMEDASTEASSTVLRTLQTVQASDPAIISCFLWKNDTEGVALMGDPEAVGNLQKFLRRVKLSLHPDTPVDFSFPGFRVIGPFYEDGTFLVNCLAEVIDPQNGESIAWLGIDYLARPWFQNITNARLRVFGVLALLIAGLVILRSYRSRFDELSYFETQKQAIARQERERIGLEIHNDLGQRLAAISLQAAALQARCKDSAPELAASAMAIAKTAGDATKEARDIALGLLPELQLKHGLGPALSQMVDRSENLFQTRIELALAEKVASLGSGPLSLAIFRICQECITNAVRHGGASDITVTAAESGGEITLMIWDNGRGFDTTTFQEDTRGLGLSYLIQQVRELRGRWDIHSSPDGGTRIHVVLPWSAKGS